MKLKQPIRGRFHRLYLLMVLVAMPFEAMAVGPVSAEYRLKAALIYKLTRFVEWPPAVEASPRSRFDICVLGRDDFGSALDALRERKVNGASIAIRRYAQSEGINGSCRILFISDSKQPFMEPILQSLERRSILTIGDTRQFAEKGGMIQFTRGRKRIGFKINLETATASGLKIAAPLLELATIVETRTTSNRP